MTPKPATRELKGACASSSLAFREAVFAIASGFLRHGSGWRFRTDVASVDGASRRRFSAGGQPVRTSGRIHLPWCVWSDRNRLFRSIRGIARAPNERNRLRVTTMGGSIPMHNIASRYGKLWRRRLRKRRAAARPCRRWSMTKRNSLPIRKQTQIVAWPMHLV